jgi:exonuclease VII large subunit
VLASTREGEPLLSAEAARDAEELRLRFADGALPARVTER